VYFDERSPAGLVEEVIKMDMAIQMAQEKLDMIARDPELLRSYERYEQAASDWTTGINGARQEGLKEGLKEGLNKGLSKGLNKGRKEGRLEEQLKVARKALAEGASVDFISRITGLDVADINRLQV
jgi:predicted transposase/invertase (TIGR01784 family)